MEQYLCSTYTLSCRGQGKLPFLPFTNAIFTLSKGPMVEAWEPSNTTLMLTLVFFILCIEICHGKIPAVYQFSVEVCHPCCLRHTHTAQVQSVNKQLFNCSNHKQLHVSAHRMFQKSKIGKLYSKKFYVCCYKTSFLHIPETHGLLKRRYL
jgi:hypothetical protein